MSYCEVRDSDDIMITYTCLKLSITGIRIRSALFDVFSSG